MFIPIEEALEAYKHQQKFKSRRNDDIDDNHMGADFIENNDPFAKVSHPLLSDNVVYELEKENGHRNLI